MEVCPEPEMALKAYSNKCDIRWVGMSIQEFAKSTYRLGKADLQEKKPSSIWGSDVSEQVSQGSIVLPVV